MDKMNKWKILGFATTVIGALLTFATNYIEDKKTETTLRDLVNEELDRRATEKEEEEEA